MMIWRDFLHESRLRAESALDRVLPEAHSHPESLHEAMRYAVLGGGKRMRPALVYAAGQAIGVQPEVLDAPACAVELIHAFSLVHDDLPCMDNDDLRHGKPACHARYGEAQALLVGDALQALAFSALADNTHLDPTHRIEQVLLLARATGSLGMTGGQALDLAAVGQTLDLARLEDIHIHKTGALIRASVLLGAAGFADPQTCAALDHYAKCIGLAFQIQDDILDVTADTTVLGKRQGSDAALEKPTYPALMGLTEAKEHAHTLIEDALTSLERLDARAQPLRELAHYIIARTY